MKREPGEFIADVQSNALSIRKGEARLQRIFGFVTLLMMPR
jgi:hypothetical protein